LLRFGWYLIKGNCTEGSLYYIGIPEYLYSIGQVKSAKYPTYADYAKEYFTRADLNDTGAYVLPYEIYDKSQDPYIAEYWETISKFFVDYTFNYLKNQLDKGCQVWIVSASPAVYIKPIVKYLPVTKIVAIELGKIISYGPGKLQRVQALTDARLTGVVSYTGDSWNNDGLLLTALRNYNPVAELQYINHGQVKPTSDTYENLQLYHINRIDAYQQLTKNTFFG
jgi:hypothetical protein